MRRGVKDPSARVDRQPVGRHRRQAGRGRNPCAPARRQRVDAEVRRDVKISRVRVECDVRDRLVAEIVVNVRPGRLLADWVVGHFEHMARCCT